jgi:glycosyltransferase involved in cell wall biosynthesis
MKSVCIITQTNGFGGVEAHTLALMSELIARRYHVEFISNRHHEYDSRIESNGWTDKVSLIHTDLDGIVEAGDDADEWEQVFKDLNSRTLIFPKGHSNHGGLAFGKACRQRFKKVIVIEHLEADPVPMRIGRLWFGFVPGIGFRWHLDRLVRKFRSFRYADRIIAVSDAVKDRLVRDWGYLPSRITVSHNGIDWQRLARNEESGRQVRERYGISPDTFVFGMLARLDPIKGIDIALRALQLLVETGIDKPVTLVIAGDGPQREDLQRLARELSIEPYVKFLGFVRDSNALVSAYDVILFSSRVEGLPLGLIEGMAAGCLPIVTRVSGMPEVVSSPEIGWVVTPENPQDLSEAMREALSLSQLTRTKMRENGLRQIQKNFDQAESHRKIFEACGL